MSESPSNRADSAPTESGMSEEKPHPSEFLEFARLGPSVIPAVAPRRSDGAPENPSDSILNPTQSNDEMFRGLVASVPGYRRMSVDARAATRAEHKMSFAQGIRLSPKAIAWSILLSCTIIMEGYDTALITAFYAFPVFRRSYGTKLPNTDDYQITPPWQSGLLAAALCGEILGLACNGWLTNRFGYRRTLLGALIWLAVFMVYLPK
jgi:hypothetical protein